ncbi:Prohibitin-1 [Ranunculus cassubicifolius]
MEYYDDKTNNILAGLGSGGIVFNRYHGVKDKQVFSYRFTVYPEGTHLLIPFIERPIVFDLRASLSRYETYSGILPSIMQETLKVVVAKYNVNQLITQREAVSKEIREILDKRAAQFNIAVDDVSITDLTFGKEFTAAIEAKQIAAQEAERAKFIVEKAEQDKKSAVIQAQGEAKSAQLIGQSNKNNPAFIALRKIEAAREIARKISMSNNKVYLNSGDLLLNLQGIEMEGAKN